MTSGHTAGRAFVGDEPARRAAEARRSSAIFAAGPGVSILCGRFEGFDERLFEARPIALVSVGDYVLSGGEVAALALLMLAFASFPGGRARLPAGTRKASKAAFSNIRTTPVLANVEGRTIPEVLRSGDHAKIAAWRKAKAEEETRLRRPDLIERHWGARRPPPSGAQHEDESEPT